MIFNHQGVRIEFDRPGTVRPSHRLDVSDQGTAEALSLAGRVDGDVLQMPMVAARVCDDECGYRIVRDPYMARSDRGHKIRHHRRRLSPDPRHVERISSSRYALDRSQILRQRRPDQDSSIPGFGFALSSGNGHA